MSTQPPAFGPTEILGDEGETPFAVVRIALAMPLEQLRAALAIGHAEMAGEPPLNEMPIADIRREVEGYLGANAVVEAYRETTAINALLATPDNRQHRDDLDTAINRAYTPWPTLPAQQPRYGDGTVTLTTLDHGEITIPEPAWCTGHDGEQIVHRADVTHVGATVTGEYQGVEFLPVRLAWAPFAERQAELLADVDEFPGMDAGELRDFADAVAAHAGHLHTKANELDRLRGEHQ